MDVGLILSALAAFAAAETLGWYRAPSTQPSGLFDAGVWPAMVGVVVGRMSSLALDDPSSVTSLRDVLAVRGGVEFWAGLAAALVVVGVTARRHHVAVLARFADLAPYGLAAAAGYQATCVVREGCFGPASPVGLRPDGFHDVVFPVELAGAAVLIWAAVGLLRGTERRIQAVTIAAAVAALAVERSVVSIWLPVVGDGLSRAHLSSVVIAVISVATLIAAVPRSRLNTPEPSVGGTA